MANLKTQSDTITGNRQRQKAVWSSWLVLALFTLLACNSAPAQAATTYGTQLSYDFDTTSWAGAVTEAVGTIDTFGSAAPSLGLRSSSLITSGQIAISLTETNLGKITLAFSLSASAAKPVTLTVESYDASHNRTGGLQTLIYPAAPNFYQRYAVDLSTMKPSGAGTFVPNAPYVSFSYSIGGTPWSGVSSPEIRLDNVHYALPAYYVRPSTEGGNNSNSGRSESAAFATPQRGLDLAQAGDIVDVMAGTYQGGTTTSTADYGTSSVASFPRIGSPAKWIVLKNYPGQMPTLESNGWNMVNISQGYNGNISTIPLGYLEVRGLRVRGQGDVAATRYASYMGLGDSRVNSNGIAVDGRYNTNVPHHIRIADNIVEYCPGGGISVLEGDYAQIENNISRNNCWTCIYAPSGISVLGDSNFDAADNIYKHLVRNNVCYGNQTFVPWHSTGKISDGNGIILDVNQKTSTFPNGAYIGRTLVQSNLCFNNGGSGIHSYFSYRVDIINNTAYMNSASPALQYAQIFTNASNDCKVINNIMVAPVAPTGSPAETACLNLNSTNCVFSNNLYFGGNNAPFMGTNGVIADPQFVNPSIDGSVANFHLLSISPARGAGIAQTFSPYLDLDGNIRAVTPDKGAYQLTATATALTSSLNPSVAGGVSVTFTAGVTGSGPTGTVTFMDGVTVLGTGTLTSGTATFTASSLAGGSHSITAAYGGDNGNAPSTSAALTQVVTLPVISGTVTLPNRTDMTAPMTMTLTPTGSTTGGVITQNVTLGSTGSFSIANVPVGTYTLGIKGPQWLNRDVSVSTLSGTPPAVSVSLLAGDITGDNQVAGADLAMVRAAFGTVIGMSTWNPLCDLNGDGTITTADMAMVRVNYGRLGDP